MFYVVAQSPEVFAKTFGWLGVAAFAAGTIGISRHLFRRDPIVVIDDAGILDTRMGVGRISWQDILGVTIEWDYYLYVRFIVLLLRNDAKYLARLPRWKRLGLTSGRWLGASPFRINLVGLSPGRKVVYSYLQDRMRLHAVV